MKLQDLIPRREFPDEGYRSDPEVIIHKMLQNMARQIDTDDRIISDLQSQIIRQNEILDIVADHIIFDDGWLSVKGLFDTDADYHVIKAFLEERQKAKEDNGE